MVGTGFAYEISAGCRAACFSPDLPRALFRPSYGGCGEQNNDVGNVTAVHLAKIFRCEIKKWPDGKNVVLVLHKASAGETETLERLLKVNAAEWKVLIAAHGDSILIEDSDGSVLRRVQSTPGAVGLVDVRSVDNTINVVHVDGKLPIESGYLPH
jgi:ABC-type phosphate transport system substrate-binding protein